jgi:hypothetical protein
MIHINPLRANYRQLHSNLILTSFWDTLYVKSIQFVNQYKVIDFSLATDMSPSIVLRTSLIITIKFQYYEDLKGHVC